MKALHSVCHTSYLDLLLAEARCLYEQQYVWLCWDAGFVEQFAAVCNLSRAETNHAAVLFGNS